MPDTFSVLEGNPQCLKAEQMPFEISDELPDSWRSEYRFIVREPSRTRISASAKTLDATLALFAEGQQSRQQLSRQLIVESDDRSNTNNGPEIDIHLDPGTYGVQLSGTSSTLLMSEARTYRVEFSFEPAEEPSSAIPAGQRAWAITRGDFDGDGDSDLATSNFESGDVSILLNLGNGQFTTAATYEVGNNPPSLVSGDFNGDGFLDLAVENDSDQTVSFLINHGNGKGTFGSQITVRPGNKRLGISLEKPGRVAAGDVNGDGTSDLVIPDNEGNVWILAGPVDASGQNRFTKLDPLKADDEVRSVAVGDVNEDGKADLVATFDRASQVAVWVQREVGGFPEKPTQIIKYSHAEGPDAIVLSDFDQDGSLDFATANDKSDNVSVHLGNGDGTFDESGERYDAGIDTEFVLAGDLDGDGFPDLVAGNEDSRDLTILMNRGTELGDFYPPISKPVYVTVDEMAVGMFNQDDRRDLAVVSRDNGVTVLLGLGDGTFQQDTRVRVGDDPQAIAAGDWNRDDIVDFAIANGGTDDVSVVLGRGGANFHPESRFSVGAVPRAVVSVDLNRDQRLDLVTVNEQSKDISVLLGLGNGEFRRLDQDLEASGIQDVTVGFSPVSVVVGDFDQDGFSDLATANRRSNNVAIVYGLGDGTFKQPRFRSVGFSPTKIILGDFNSDGRDDLGTVNRLSHDVSILLNTQEGVFLNERRRDQFPTRSAARIAASVEGWKSDVPAHAQKDSTQFYPRDLVIEDFNNDQYDDIVVADDRNNAISLFLGREDGQFQPAIWFPSADDPEDLAAADLNNDGNMDLMTANDGDDSFSIWLGAGNGMFAEEQKYGEDDGVPKAPESVLAGDFDNDELLDIAVAGEDDETLSIFQQQTDGTFRRINIETDGIKQGMVAADFNKDGYLDIAAPSHSTEEEKTATIDLLLGNGTGGFAEPSKTVTPDARIRALSAVDVDADGWIDLVAADRGAKNRVWILWGLGQGEFDAQQINLGAGPAASTRDPSIRPVVVDDFNADHVLDVATVDEVRNQVVVLLGDGQRSFPTILQLPAGDGPGALDAADVNGDGRVDLVAGNRDSFDLSLVHYIGHGPLPLNYPPPISGRQEPDPEIRVDVNGDSRKDILTADQNRNQLTVRLNDENGFKDSQQLATDFQSTPRLLDVDDDGLTDLVQVDNRGNLLLRFRDPENPKTFKTPKPLNSEHHPVRDVAVVSTRSGTYLAATMLTTEGLQPERRINSKWQPSKSKGAIAFFPIDQFIKQPSWIGTEPFPTRIASADLNKDGQDDLVAIEAGQQNVAIFLADSQGQFSLPPTRVTVGNVPTALALLDVSRNSNKSDGSIDIVVANKQSGDVHVLKNDGAGQFGSNSVRHRASDGLYHVSARCGGRRPCGEFGAPESFVVTSLAQSADVAGRDLDNDGFQDLVLTHTGLNTISILWGKENGRFIDPHSQPAGSAPTELVVADLDNDEDLDLAVLNQATNTVSSFVNNGRGEFQHLPDAANVGDAASGLTVSDVNSDKVKDLLVASESGDLLVLLGNEDGTFAPIEKPPGGDEKVSLTIGDVDGDKKADLVVTSRAEEVISVIRGGDQSRSLSGGLKSPGATVLADLNVDGVDDLVVANTGANNILVYLGDKDGLKEDAREYFVGTGPVHISVEDLNNDLIPDLVVSNRDSNDLSVLFGRGEKVDEPNLKLKPETWELQDGVRLATGEGPVSTTIADIASGKETGTGDGILDILVTNRNLNRVQLLPGLGNGFFDDTRADPVFYDVGKEPFETIVTANALLVINGKSDNIARFADWDPKTREFFKTGGRGPVAVELADVNNDRNVDLLIAHEDDNTVQLFLRSASGFFFTEPTPLPFSVQDGFGVLSDIAVHFNGSRFEVILSSLSRADFQRVSFDFAIELSTSLIAARIALPNRVANNVSPQLQPGSSPPTSLFTDRGEPTVESFRRFVEELKRPPLTPSVKSPFERRRLNYSLGLESDEERSSDTPNPSLSFENDMPILGFQDQASLKLGSDQEFSVRLPSVDDPIGGRNRSVHELFELPSFDVGDILPREHQREPPGREGQRLQESNGWIAPTGQATDKHASASASPILRSKTTESGYVSAAGKQLVQRLAPGKGSALLAYAGSGKQPAQSPMMFKSDAQMSDNDETTEADFAWVRESTWTTWGALGFGVATAAWVEYQRRRNRTH